MQNQQNIGGSFSEATEPQHGYISNMNLINHQAVQHEYPQNMQSFRAPGTPHWGINPVLQHGIPFTEAHYQLIHYWSPAPINTPYAQTRQHTVTPGASSSRGGGFSQYLPGQGSHVLGQGYVPRVLPEPLVHFPALLGFGAGDIYLMQEFVRVGRMRSEIRAALAFQGGQLNMPLDVDTMSYEQLLALGDEIGTVKTGLKKETIMKNLKQGVYLGEIDGDSTDAEPCCICQEDYVDGDALGMLDCGHIYHTGCIKRWLVEKNICPICKKTALSNRR